ncbi:hypothetical protein [Candidatus Regiella endosymbiont of Tuberolachnus salignus]|uniref:hypothetical protein n=1 Tax=Candidatus Regiella endosymbiont of Tuberolachnus salignus TaxID=3077956 RepID=UPI0030D5D843
MPKIHSSVDHVIISPDARHTMTLHEKKCKIKKISHKLESAPENLSKDERISFRSDLLYFSKLYRFETNVDFKKDFESIIVKCYLKTINYDPKTKDELKNEEEKFIFIEKFSVKKRFNPNMVLPGSGIQSYKDTLYHNYAFHLINSVSVASEIADEAHEIYNKVIHKDESIIAIIEKLQSSFQKLEEANQQMMKNKSISVDITSLEKDFNDLIAKNEIDIDCRVTENIKSLKKYSHLEEILKQLDA